MNHVEILGQNTVVTVYTKDGKSKKFIFDREDYPLLKKINKPFRLYSQRGYIGYQDGGKIIYLHRLLKNFPKGKVVDHIDGNEWNNKRENLRVVTYSQNSRNRHRQSKPSNTGHRNVYFDKANNVYRVLLKQGKKILISRYFSKDKLKEAVEYASLARELIYGEHAGSVE